MKKLARVMLAAMVALCTVALAGCGNLMSFINGDTITYTFNTNYASYEALSTLTNSSFKAEFNKKDTEWEQLQKDLTAQISAINESVSSKGYMLAGFSDKKDASSAQITVEQLEEVDANSVSSLLTVSSTDFYGVYVKKSATDE